MKIFRPFLLLLALTVGVAANAEYRFGVYGELSPYAGSNDFAPFYISSNRHDKLTQSKGLLLDVGAVDSLDRSKRFDFSWGVEALAGVANSVDYRRWDPASEAFVANPQHPANIRLQQLYAEVKWRCLLLSAGMQSRGSAFVNNRLSSGDVVWSGNARAIPEVRIGFVDFQNIPFTRGWVQADLCISYGKFFDKDWVENHFNRYEGRICPSPLWTYKRIYLRTNPTKPFYFQFGIQMSGLFGGTTYTYDKGKVTREVNNYGGFGDFFKMIFQLRNSREGYMMGDHKGSYDGAATYRLRSGHTLKAYFQWFWEDGSGMSKSNGFDGLWGLEYRAPKRTWLNGVVVEYLDFTNQSGPIHFAPADNPDSFIHQQVQGNDCYYATSAYRPYTNYGMTIGTPLVMGTIYNLDGNPELYATRVRAYHLGAEGAIGSDFDWTLKFNYRKAWGNTNSYAILHPIHATSFYLGAAYRFPRVKGLKISAEFGLDSGNAPQNACGALIGLGYDFSL